MGPFVVCLNSERSQDTEKRMARLQFVLQRSAVFSGILKTRMDEEKERQLKLQAEKRKQQAGSKRTRGTQASPKGKKRKGADGKAQVLQDDVAEEDDAIFQQPALITGARLKPYQLEGLQWMVSLDQNGISGILGTHILFLLNHPLKIPGSGRDGSGKDSADDSI